MYIFDHRWFTLGALIAIALFATVCALTIQIIFGRNLVTLLAGPAISIVAAIVFCARQGRFSGKRQ
jgi:hypothetical protein